MALDTLRANKMRSALTVLGIVIGITSIVGMTSLIRGFDESLQSTIGTLGPKTIFVAKFSALSLSSGASFIEMVRRPEHHGGGCRSDHAAGAVGGAWSTSGWAPAASRRWSACSIAASAPGRCRSWARPSASSRSTSRRSSPAASFTEREVQRRKAVAVLGYGPYEALFEQTRHRSDRQEGPHRRRRVHGHRRHRQAARRSAGSTRPGRLRDHSVHGLSQAVRVRDAPQRRAVRRRAERR